MVAIVFAGAMEISHAYDRPPPREDLFVSLAEDADSTTPQQVLNYYFYHFPNFIIEREYYNKRRNNRFMCRWLVKTE